MILQISWHEILIDIIQLLQAIGAVEKVPSAKAEPYQDSVTAGVDRSLDDEEVWQEDGTDKELDLTALKFAILKVRMYGYNNHSFIAKLIKHC